MKNLFVGLIFGCVAALILTALHYINPVLPYVAAFAYSSFVIFKLIFPED